ncbi:retinoblastoma-binding protein 5 [Reticulomyxa filosa]|uniref:Retinoblastoma-binding protein 5 n=1 Tax=Reticulomyxa filosa TaxID=46433 RepID=X6MUP3_RETFI|nr:retinoblastoma-binding protein 5 [Reticulomyxa filosa]|eukprot:ETO17549.1 retinoblastoma-binding protein 5 [Reticulomyxa filosa]
MLYLYKISQLCYTEQWHPIDNVLACIVESGEILIWKEERKDHWCAFAPGFQILDENVWTINCYNNYNSHNSDNSDNSNDSAQMASDKHAKSKDTKASSIAPTIEGTAPSKKTWMESLDKKWDETKDKTFDLQDKVDIFSLDKFLLDEFFSDDELANDVIIDEKDRLCHEIVYLPALVCHDHLSSYNSRHEMTLDMDEPPPLIAYGSISSAVVVPFFNTLKTYIYIYIYVYQMQHNTMARLS